jgi:hypothetical protein
VQWGGIQELIIWEVPKWKTVRYWWSNRADNNSRATTFYVVITSAAGHAFVVWVDNYGKVRVNMMEGYFFPAIPGGLKDTP